VGLTIETSLEDLFNYYESMKYFGRYSTFEVDNLIPFERDIKFNLLQKILKEVNKQDK